ncbi:MAG: DUF4157 domain-containing protein [Rhodobacteraceae bacterium]|nr:DUF4157 domain-containing protein [Paracoccaceae bacterium]
MSRASVKLAAPKPAKAESKARKGRARAAVRQAAKTSPAAPAPSAAALAAAAAQPTRVLPHRDALEQRFGRGLGQIRVAQGPVVTRALDAAGAEAATVGDRVLLRPEAPLGTVAHEAAHALQPEQAQGGDSDRAEAEAQRVEAQTTSGTPVAPVRAARVPGMVAFKAPDNLAGARVVPKPDPAATKAFREAERTPDAQQQDAQAPAQTQAEPVAPTAQGASPDTSAARGDTPGASGADAGEPPVPTFAAPSIPELDVDTDAVKEAAAAADAQIEAARDAGGMMAAFRTAPPSVKALRHDQLSGNARTLAEEDQAQFDQDLPKFEAKLSGTDDLAALPPVGAPTPEAPALEDGTPAPAPLPEVDPTPATTAPPLNPGGSVFAGLATPGDAASMGSAFAKLSTNDDRIETSAGTRPSVPTSGETDPGRVASQDKAAREQADAKAQAASKAVLEGRGPEEAGLKTLREEMPVAPRSLPETEAVETTAPGAVAFREGGHDAEVTALFDAHHGGPMAESLTQAEAETGAAVAKRNSDRDAKLTEAKAETDKLNRTADEGQRTEVLARRKDIQAARGKAVADQKGHVDALKTQAETDRKAAKTEVDLQITTTDAQVAKDFTKAEGDAQAEVTAGEAKAEAERTRQKANAEKQSWWDRAKSWVQEQFDKLTTFINGVFDAVRKAVKKLIDAVKTAALKLIDAAAKAIKAAIEKLGTALKAAVSALLEKHFPEVAKALNEAIDTAVAAAKTAVDKVAEGLKTAVAAVLDTLAKGIDAILALYQKAINAALNLAKIALTADWGALAKMVLEPILLAFGIKPAEFYALIGKAIDALDIIVKNPAGFIKNLVKSVVGGLKLFGGKLFEHLQKGIIGWLTGALGSDLKIPKTWTVIGVLDLARQIMGLTLDFIRRIAVRVLGEKAVTVIEQVMGTIATFVKGGFAALWEQIKGAVGNIQSLVLEQIKSFLFERVLLASVTWLASLFNPAGAIAKLIMMTWNVLMFIKDQLGRMVDLVKKVFGTLYEIATGVLEPAQKGVEAVLGRTLPLVIDLFARLLGLGNVAGRVKKIIDGVRQKIEDAIVKLIKRIVGRGKGKGGKADKKKKDRTDDLMKPITVKGGGERHTLFIREKGKKAVPVMRSVETPVEVWLKRHHTEAGLKSLYPGQDAATLTDLLGRVKPLVARALTEEAQLEAVAEAENLSEDARLARKGSASPGPTPQGASKLKAEGAELGTLLSAILQQVSGSASKLEIKFVKNIANLSPELREPVRKQILRRLQESRYRGKTWQELIAASYADSDLTQRWVKPVHSLGNGILRDQTVGKRFRIAVAKIANGRIKAANASKKFDEANPDEKLNPFFKGYLAGDLRDKSQAIYAAMLTKRTMADVATAFTSEIERATERYANDSADGPDRSLFDDVKASNIRKKLLAFANGTDKGSYDSWATNATEKNKPGTGAKKTGNLLTVTKTQSFRPTKNATYLASMVRTAANTGVDRPHEWIKSASVTKLLQRAADGLKTGNGRTALLGATELIEFQHYVRTPTTRLVFKPKQDFAYGKPDKVKVGYRAPEHLDSSEHRGTAPDALPEEQQQSWYPRGLPAASRKITILQGHSGGIFARAQGGTHEDALVQQHQGSTEWHKTLEAAVDKAIDELPATGKAIPLREAILGHFKRTIWQGSAQLDADSRAFRHYYDSRSEGSPLSYEDLRTKFDATTDKTLEKLETAMNKVIAN